MSLSFGSYILLFFHSSFKFMMIRSWSHCHLTCIPSRVHVQYAPVLHAPLSPCPLPPYPHHSPLHRPLLFFFRLVLSSTIFREVTLFYAFFPQREGLEKNERTDLDSSASMGYQTSTETNIWGTRWYYTRALHLLFKLLRVSTKLLTDSVLAFVIFFFVSPHLPQICVSLYGTGTWHHLWTFRCTACTTQGFEVLPGGTGHAEGLRPYRVWLWKPWPVV